MTDTTGRARPAVRPKVDNSALVRRRDSRAAEGRPPPVPAKAKVAIAVLLEQPEQDLAAAAKAAGLPTKRLKQYMKTPHVRQYFIAERQVLLDAICAGNPTALKAVRDNAENQMARVNAVRGLESMREEHEQHGVRGSVPAPGVIIVIESRDGRQEQLIGPAPPVIEHVQEAGISDEA